MAMKTTIKAGVDRSTGQTSRLDRIKSFVVRFGFNPAPSPGLPFFLPTGSNDSRSARPAAVPPNRALGRHPGFLSATRHSHKLKVLWYVVHGVWGAPLIPFPIVYAYLKVVSGLERRIFVEYFAVGFNPP